MKVDLLPFILRDDCIDPEVVGYWERAFSKGIFEALFKPCLRATKDESLNFKFLPFVISAWLGVP